MSSAVQTALYAGLLVLTVRSRRVKILLVRTVQRWTINPLMRLLFAIGINPLGLAILETRGRRSGKPRRVPVGNGRKVTRSGSSPNTASAPDTCATSSTTRGSGCGYGSACATAGYPASPPSCPMTTPWHANDASSAGTRSRLQRNQRACAGCRPAHRARATHARRVTRSNQHQHQTNTENADRQPDPRARRRAPRPVAEPLA